MPTNKIYIKRAFYGLLFIILINILSCSSSAKSQIAPLVNLLEYKLNEDKIYTKVKVRNIVNKNIKNVLLYLRCISPDNKELGFHVLLSSQDNSESLNSKGLYTINHHHIMRSGFDYQETKELAFEININKSTKIKYCEQVYIRGYK